MASSLYALQPEITATRQLAFARWVTPLKFKYYKYYYNAPHTNHLEES
ncbi:hypothetical protein [Helicobacter pylori]|nr:hypothetical protein [Helicobacter pylori]